MNQNIIKDLLREIKAEQIAQRELLEQLLGKSQGNSLYQAMSVKERMAKARAAKGKGVSNDNSNSAQE